MNINHLSFSTSFDSSSLILPWSFCAYAPSPSVIDPSRNEFSILPTCHGNSRCSYLSQHFWLPVTCPGSGVLEYMRARTRFLSYHGFVKVRHDLLLPQTSQERSILTLYLLNDLFFFHPFYTESVEGDQSSVTLSSLPGKNWCRDAWMLWRSWISDLEQCRSKFWPVIL